MTPATGDSNVSIWSFGSLSRTLAIGDGIVYSCLAQDFDKNSSKMVALNETSLRGQFMHNVLVCLLS